MEFNVRDKRVKKWDKLVPEYRITNDLEPISVEFKSYPTVEQLAEMCVGPLLATWSRAGDVNNRRYDVYNLTDEDKMKILYRAMHNNGFLPGFRDMINFVLCIDGIHHQETTHLYRHKWSASAMCTGDNPQNVCDIAMPESYEKLGFKDRYLKLVDDAMNLYCDMMNTHEISNQDCRLVTPKTVLHFVYPTMNFNELMRFLGQRLDLQVQPNEEYILALRTYVALCEIYPFMADKFNIKNKSNFYIHETKTNFGSALFQPNEENKEVLDWTTPDDYLQKSKDELAGSDDSSILRKIQNECENRLTELLEYSKRTWPYLYTEEYKKNWA